MKFDFQNNNGEILSGNLELPEGKIKGYALFAHCFTCSKNIVAPRIISKKLTESGIGVLRFDFTGLGNSDGDFANTNFSSNVDDLISACKHLSEKFEAPKLLIGHSLGGAAVLKAAASLPKVKAVVTIGAPSDAQHVKHLFHQNLDEIENDGEAEVTLEGRNFTIKKQFIDDLKETDILKCVETFKKALLVTHSPIDNTVSIDHAAKIFLAAKHPRSFISLDDANHLLMNKEDASYAASVIGPWALRYIN
jgi:esterase/lipase